MLFQIQCDKFISQGKKRDPIIFHQGLNTILGGKSANNSIGKSTFLLIIDYVFGGDTYKNSNACHKLGNHTINFTFRFHDKDFYFSRDIINCNEVNVCDNNYNTMYTISLDLFRKWLFAMYNIDLPSVSFRDIIGRYLRIYGKDNYSELKPLNSYSEESGEKAITALEKLFNVYSKIEEYKNVESIKKEKQKVFKNARSHEFISHNITTKKQFIENEKKIEELNLELNQMMDKADKDLCDENLSNADKASEIKGKITAIKRQRSNLLSQINLINISIEGNAPFSKGNLDQLYDFFPNANFKKIEEIEKFHIDIQSILSNEFLDEKIRLQSLINIISTEISCLEDQQRNLGVPTKLSKSFLDKYSQLKNKITTLKSQNKAYTDFKDLTADVKVAKENLKNKQDVELRFIESEINEQMVRYNDYIYKATRKSPVLNLHDGKKYTFTTPDDTGTGTSYKSLIIFDLSILKLTPLPAIAHDSLIFKNIGDAPIDRIMELYMQSNKQIFIAFDKENSYCDDTRKILNDTAVLYLNEGGDELFGCSWNKKEM